MFDLSVMCDGCTFFLPTINTRVCVFAVLLCYQVYLEDAATLGCFPRPLLLVVGYFLVFSFFCLFGFCLTLLTVSF